MPQTTVKPVNYTPTLLRRQVTVGGSDSSFTSFPEMPLRMYSAQRCRDQVCWADWNSNCMARMHREAWRRAPLSSGEHVETKNTMCGYLKIFSIYPISKSPKGYTYVQLRVILLGSMPTPRIPCWQCPSLTLSGPACPCRLGGGVSLSFREPDRKQGQISVSIWTSFRLRRLEQVFSNVEHSFFFQGEGTW